MLEPDQWDSVLGSVAGTVYRGIERISSNALLNLLEVGPDPVTRQKVTKRNRYLEWRFVKIGPNIQYRCIGSSTRRGAAIVRSLTLKSYPATKSSNKSMGQGIA